MASRGMAGQGCDSQPTGEKRPRDPVASGDHATPAAPPCLRCAFWQHSHHHPASNLRLATGLRVVLVDSDPGVHEFVRQTLKAYAKGWTLDSHPSPDSLLAALPLPPTAPHHQLSTPPTINRGVDAALPDVVLLEAQWPGLSGIESLRRLTALLPEPRLVIFTACADYETIVESLMGGALGYLVKPAAPGNLVYTISEAAQGRAALSGKAQGALIDFVSRLGTARRPRTLSSRECQVMLLLLTGACCKDISTKLGIEGGTVNRHVHNIYHKMGVHRKVDALRRFFGGG